MTKKKPADYRLRIREPFTGSDTRCTLTYIVRKGDRVVYVASDETPLALSNLILTGAAEMRFLLEDASTGADAALPLRAYFAERFKSNKPLMPVVEVLL